MIFANRSAVRWIVGSAAFAAWCAGSVWALFGMTRGYPGVMTMKPEHGAFELSEFGLGLPAGTALLAMFLLAFLAMSVVGGLRNGFDPERDAIRSIRWAFASSGLNAALAFIVATACLIAIAASLRPNAWTEGYFLGCLLGVFVVPFALWNADTLLQSRPTRWWRLRWPGWQAVLLALGAMLAEAVSGILLNAMADLSGPAWWLVLANAIDSAVSFLLWLLVAVAWIMRATPVSIWRSFRAMLRWRQLRALIWQGLFSTTLVVGFAVPILATAILVIFVLPQYASLAEVGTEPPSWPLRMLGRSASHGQALTWPLVLVGTVYLTLATGRLVAVLGNRQPHLRAKSIKGLARPIR